MAPKKPASPPKNNTAKPDAPKTGVQQTATPNPAAVNAASPAANPNPPAPPELTPEQTAINELEKTEEQKKYITTEEELLKAGNELADLEEKKGKGSPEYLEQEKNVNTRRLQRDAARSAAKRKYQEIKDKINGVASAPPVATAPREAQQAPVPTQTAPVVNNEAINALQETPEEKKVREERQKALKEQLTGDDGAAKLRLGYQAALILMMDKILDESAKVSGGVDRRKVQYANFATTRTGQVGHVDFSNALFKTKDTRLFFNAIPPQILSAMVPSVKLYFVVYPEIQGKYVPSADNESKNGKGFSWRIPFDDLPSNYKNESSEFVSDFSIDKILKNEAKMNGCGIKSFQYAYKGTNPAETNSHIEASLELFFQDINLLTKKIIVNENDARFIDGQPEGLGEKEFLYSHLINGASRFIKNGAKLLSNDQYFRIKAEVGYAEPSEIFIAKLKETSGLKGEDIQSYINAIKTAKISFFLSPITHDITFNEDGSILLKINYQATIDAILSDYNLNIFSVTAKDEELKNAQKKLENILDERQRTINDAKCKNLNKAKLADSLKIINDRFVNVIQKQKSSLDNLKNQSQEEMFKKLVGLETMPNRNSPPGVYKVGILNSAVGVDKDGKPISGALQFRLLEGATIREKGLSNHQIINVNDIPKSSANATAQAPREGNSPTSKKAYSLGMYGLEADEAAAARQPPNAVTDSGYTIIKYIYLGDIIDIAAECLPNAGPAGDRPKIILGEIPINIPTNISSEENDLLVPEDADVIERVVNIADIPISLEAFDDFYYQKVIKQKRADYPLLNFIKDVIELLLIPSINPSTFGRKAVINNKIRISHFGFLLPYQEGGKDLLLGKGLKENFNGIIDPERLKEIAGEGPIKRSYSQEVSKNGFGNYLLIYDSMSPPARLTINNGKIDLDENSGIYHFEIGKEAGIIKTINFSKTDIPLAAEARALQEGGKVTNRLRQMYSSEIRLFGNNIFRPGDYIYIDPIFYGVDTQDAIGLGGYYMVTKVNTSITPNNFETVLSCYHQAWVIDGKTRTPTSNKNTCS